MKSMNYETVAAINQALLFQSQEPYRKPEVRPWQVVQMEYERVGMMPPATVPHFETREDAEIWMCLDADYNSRLRETGWLQAV